MSGSSIPLAGLNPDIGASVGQGIGNAQNLLQLQEQFKTVKRQNALRGILGQPGAIDQTGQPTADTMEKVMGVDPEAGMKLRQNALVTQEQKLRMQVLNTDSFAKTIDLVGKTYEPILSTYEDALKAGKPPTVAEAEAQEGMTKAYDQLSNGGALTPDQVARLPRKFDPVQLRNAVAGSKAYQDMRKERLAEDRLGRQEAEDARRNQRAGTTTASDNEGNPVIIQPNAPAGTPIARYIDGTAVPPEKLRGAHKMGTAAPKVEEITIDGIRGEGVLLGDQWFDTNGQRITGKVERVNKTTDTGRDSAAVDADLKTQHPEWTPGQIVTERKRILKQASTSDTPGKAAERDAMSVADKRIQDREAQLGRPLDDFEKAEQRQVARSDPKIQEATRKLETTAISDEAAEQIAEQSLHGDWHGTTGLGRNAASMRKIADARARKAKELGITGADLAANTAEFMGITAAERVLGTRGAGIDLGIAEAQIFAPMVLERSEKVKRTQFPTINAMQQAIQKGTGGEDVIRLTDALNAYKMAYTQILTRGGMPTDDARRRSDEVINQAWSNGQIKAAIDQLNQEMVGARSAVPEVRNNLYRTLTNKDRPAPDGRSGAPANNAQPSAQPAAGQQPPGVWQQGQPIPPKAIEMLKASPGTAEQFERTFGPGSAQQYIKPAAPTAPTTESRTTTPPAAAESYPVPETYKDKPDGTTFNKGALVKRGDKLVPNTTNNDQAADLKAAKDVIDKGAPRDAVIKRLRDAGIDPKGL